MCRDVLHTDPLQFGFTSGVGCSEAIFALKSTINHFIQQNGSCVYASSLDISKAFDKVNHFKLFTSLIK